MTAVYLFTCAVKAARKYPPNKKRWRVLDPTDYSDCPTGMLKRLACKKLILLFPEKQTEELHFPRTKRK